MKKLKYVSIQVKWVGVKGTIITWLVVYGDGIISAESAGVKFHLYIYYSFLFMQSSLKLNILWEFITPRYKVASIKCSLFITYY